MKVVLSDEDIEDIVSRFTEKEMPYVYEVATMAMELLAARTYHDAAERYIEDCIIDEHDKELNKLRESASDRYLKIREGE